MAYSNKFNFPSLYSITALFLASVYFCFQVEVFEEEYEKNQPISSGRVAYNYSSVNWESFDKDNVPEPFRFDALALIDQAPDLPDCGDDLLTGYDPTIIIRCKSPPDEARIMRRRLSVDNDRDGGRRRHDLLSQAEPTGVWRSDSGSCSHSCKPAAM